MHGKWPCTPIKTKPRRNGMKLVSDTADPCQLLDDGRGGGGGRPLSLLQLHSGDSTALRCDTCLLLQQSLAGADAAYHVSLYQLTTIVSMQAVQTPTFCTPFSIIVWVFPYPYIGAKIRYPEFWISVNNTSNYHHFMAVIQDNLR